MLPVTMAYVKDILAQDPTIDAAARKIMLAGLAGHGNEKTVGTGRVPRIVKRSEAAEMLSCSLRTVDNLAREGHLKKYRMPGRRRACGFLREDVESLLSGGGHE